MLPEGGLVSSAILYGAIVVIWAGVLIPRWLRRESSAESATESTTEEATVTTEVVPEPAVVSEAPASAAASASADDVEPRKSEHARIVAARRRLLGMLVALALGSYVLFVSSLAAWWVVLPPSVMLAGYLALLREASRADAERLAARRAREAAAARAATGAVAPEAPEVLEAPEVPVPVSAPDAEVIDITGRVSEEFYDQYADSRRAVGD